MKTNLKEAICHALAGSSSQQPVDVAELYKLGARKKVEAALLEMYRQQKVGCCLITRDSISKSVWWLIGGVSAPISFRRLCAPKVAVGRTI